MRQCVFLKGVEAGADGIDTAISPLALGTSHAPTESMVAAFAGTPYDTGLDIKQLAEIRAYFMTLREKYFKNGLLDQKMLATDAKALIYQVPGGMLSNLLSQLKQAGKEDKLQRYLRKFREFVKMQVTHRSLLLHHRLLVHRLYSM